ncbi:MAG: hypothetical protein KGL48_15480 [Sphingomonadales bacterium]|nr:hypothetical protein [Sphingomonadales bacterium]MDE2567530.1 hypothetical protein [Sphingomonadales bacterium]
MLRASLVPGLLSASLCGCVTVDATRASAEPERMGAPEYTCRADAAQSFVGQAASAGAGAEMMKAAGATQLRWVPPRTAVTMMFVNGRLTVAYDDEMKITRISCN